MATPFDVDGRLDVDGAVALARYLADNGSDALVVTGTTGEGPTLADRERAEVWEAVASAVQVPLIAGSGSNDTAHSVELTKVACSVGAAGILAVTPYYNRPGQAGIAAHFGAMAEAAGDVPVLLYDVPVRTGRKVALDTFCSVAARHPNVVGVKDAAGDLVATARLAGARLVGAAPPGFEIYCGEDLLTLPMLAVGAVGVVSVASHWVGPELSELIRCYFDGDVEAATELHLELFDSVAFQSSEDDPNPLPAKAVLRALGLPAGQCRLPLGTASPDLDAAAVAMLGALEAWRSKRPAPPAGTARPDGTARPAGSARRSDGGAGG